MDTRDLIDRFISQQNRHLRSRPSSTRHSKRPSAVWTIAPGLVTETLAQIYAMQGDLPKAIDAYGRLALKYPEKSAYFAALSKELEGQLNK